MVVKAIKQEIRTLREEAYFLKGDMIRLYRYIKYKIVPKPSLDVWVVFK